MESSSSLATELLHELKSSAQRWFIIAMAELLVIVVLVCVLVFVPVEEVTVENEDGNANYIGRDLNGGLKYGEDNSEAQEGSSEETAQEEVTK